MSMASHLRLGASWFFFHEITQPSKLFQLFWAWELFSNILKRHKKTGATFKGGSLSMEATTKRLKKVTCVFFPSLEMHHGWIDYTDIRRVDVAKNAAPFLIKYVITCSNDLNLFWIDRIYEQKARHTFWYWTCKKWTKKNKDWYFGLRNLSVMLHSLHLAGAKTGRNLEPAQSQKPAISSLVRSCWGPGGWKCKAWWPGGRRAVGSY